MRCRGRQQSVASDEDFHRDRRRRDLAVDPAHDCCMLSRAAILWRLVASPKKAHRKFIMGKMSEKKSER